MSIQEEAPNIYAMLNELNELDDQLRELCNAAGPHQVVMAYEHESGEIFDALTRRDEYARACCDVIAEQLLSLEAIERFTVAVEECINDPSISMVHICLPSNCDMARWHMETEEWFFRRDFHVGSILDRSVFFSAIHPGLHGEAVRRWSALPRVTLDVQSFRIRGDEDDRLLLLREHGISEDLSTWFWAYEVLSVAKRVSEKLALPFKLCDLVEWTSTEEPPNMFVGSIFGEADLVSRAVFGEQPDVAGLERLEGCKIWRKEPGTYISPFWEFLGWSGEDKGEFSEYWRCLADIGEGLDCAVLCGDPDADPEDHSRARLTPARIFRAGEAMMRLRVKLDIEDAAVKGFKTAVAAKRGGAMRAAAAKEKSTAILTEMERLVTEGKSASNAAHIAAGRGLGSSAEANKKLWQRKKLGTKPRTVPK